MFGRLRFLLGFDNRIAQLFLISLLEKKLDACEEEKELVGSWILTSSQPHRVTIRKRRQTNSSSNNSKNHHRKSNKDKTTIHFIHPSGKLKLSFDLIH